MLLLADFRKSELKQINAYNRQLDKIAADCDIEKTAPYRQFLVSREGDFQQFIDTLKEGTNALAKMNQGSREWLEGFNTQLNQLKQASAARASTLQNLTPEEGNEP